MRFRELLENPVIPGNFPPTMPQEVKDIILSWSVQNKSPHSHSYYDTMEKSWTHTPTGSHRISDHWNFYARGMMNCPTDQRVSHKCWALGQWDGEKYVILNKFPKRKVYDLSDEEAKRLSPVQRADRQRVMDQRRLMNLSEDVSPTPLLILVHPGSACGSANFNIGRNKASLKRFELTQDLNQWQGDVLVVDGELSDELYRYKDYNGALVSAVDRAENGKRIFACAMNTPGWPKLVAKAVKAMATPDTPISITGAWLHTSDDQGCVNMVEKTVKAMGYTPTILKSAVDIDGDDDA